MPSFDRFYAAVNDGRQPFPWQSRLAAQIQADGCWPNLIGIQTGLGKTACLDIAIWWLASEAHLEPGDRVAPTRIWWVVNRRLLVDSTYDHVCQLEEKLRLPEDSEGLGHPDVLKIVGTRLRHLAGGGESAPLAIVRLRGGYADGRAPNPAQPAVILSTVPMFGSRLLFRGYGSSRSMRPIDAAHAGTDCLVLVDEAHLAKHLTSLIPVLAETAPGEQSVLPASRLKPQVVALTATGDPDSGSGRFELNGEDLAHPTVRRRLYAYKRLEVSEKDSAIYELAEATARLLDEAGRPVSCVVFVNSPATARSVQEKIVELRSKWPVLSRERADLILLTGLNRESDAMYIRAKILDPASGLSPGRALSARAKSLIVVATQTLEVGADLDFDFLVTEQCGARALTQRLGRLNRLGNSEDSRAIYVHAPALNDKNEWPVYGSEPSAMLERLKSAPKSGTGIDVAPARIAAVLGAPQDRPGRAPEMLYALLWEWIKTSNPPQGEAPVEPYFSGVVDSIPSVSLIWRSSLPDVSQRLWPRPHADEVLDISVSYLGTVNKLVFGDDEMVIRLGSDGITAESVPWRERRPGDTIVLRVDRGLLDEFGWNPEAKTIVRDYSLERNGLPLDSKALELYCDARIAQPLIDSVLQEDAMEPDEVERETAVGRLIDVLRSSIPSHYSENEWAAFLDHLSHRPIHPEGEVGRLELQSEGYDQLYDEFDEYSLAPELSLPEARLLDQHGEAVGHMARQIAEAVGIIPDYAAVIGLAGRMHDIGKADMRFQRWLTGGEPTDKALAKSSMPRSRWLAAQSAAGWPRGGRHEELSRRLVQRWLAETNSLPLDFDTDLLLHLVVSHHGKGRPLVSPVIDGTQEKVRFALENTEYVADADLSSIDWEQPERFARLNRRYGPWGLALLEAIVRQADHSVSASVERLRR